MSRGPVHCGDDGRPGCGERIDLVRIIAAQPRKGASVPLNLAYDPACGIAPSHATDRRRTICRPLGRREDPAPSEYPALIHYASCAARTHTPQENP